MSLENGFFADSMRLREHSERIREEERLVRRLLDVLHKAALTADAAEQMQLVSITEDARCLERYFHAMADTIEMTGEELELLSRKIHELLIESRNWKDPFDLF